MKKKTIIKEKKLVTRVKSDPPNLKYNNDYIIKGLKDYIQSIGGQTGALPSILAASQFLNIPRSSLVNRADSNEVIAGLLVKIKEAGELYLINSALHNKTNASFSAFLLKANYKYNDQPQALTQVNNLNVSGEWLKKALKDI